MNGTFYRLQPQSTFEKWRDETPDGFPFAIKGHRYITHNKKLIDVEEPVIRCRDAASPLGKRLAAVVWQLPAFFKKEYRATGEISANAAALGNHTACHRVSPQNVV